MGPSGPGWKGILVDLGDFALYRLIPLAVIVALCVVLFRWWRKGAL